MVVEGVCLLVVLIGRLGRRGTGLVGMPNEVPAAFEHEFGPPAVQCESQAPPDLLEEFLAYYLEVRYSTTSPDQVVKC